MSRKKEIWKTSAWTFESALKAAGVGGLLLASCAPGREPMPYFDGKPPLKVTLSEASWSCPCGYMTPESWTICSKCHRPRSPLGEDVRVFAIGLDVERSK